MKIKWILMLLVIVNIGCSVEVDDSTLEKKGDGLMYKPNSESPFSGETFGYYDSGEIFFSRVLENGKQVNNTIYYGKDGAVLNSIDSLKYLDLKDEVVGNIEIIVAYLKGTNEKYSGPIFVKEGDRTTEGVFLNGKLHGVLKVFRQGRLQTYSEYKEGLQDGVFKRWFESGQLREESFYVNGQLHGLQTEYERNGDIDKQFRYQNGVNKERLQGD